jgi:hypothetical protein
MMIFRNRSLDDLAQWAIILGCIIALDYCTNPGGPARMVSVLIFG